MTGTHHALAGRKGGLVSWSNTVDRAERTASARANSPTGVEWHLARLGPAFDDASDAQRLAAAESARKAWMAELALKSARARRAKRAAA